MRIIACAKHVVDSTEIRWDEERGEVILRNLPTKISDYDRNALEAAVVLKESADFVALEVIMVGGEPALKTLKEAVAMGADKGYLVEGGWDDPFDPMRTARVLARAVGALEEPDLILCGLVSEDGYSGVTAPALAQLLDLPYAAPVVGLSAGDGDVEAILDWGSVLRTVKVPTPCVLGIDSVMNVPRLPTVLQVMKVKADRLGKLSLADLGLSADAAELAPTATLVASRSGAVERKRIVIEGPAAESAPKLVATLKQEGVL
ncbi:MAG: electron transfer flavoprotein subunit beta/FixA family protein [Thermoleophilia bacterium]